MDQKISIRKVAHQDLPDILRIENESFNSEAFSKQQFIRHLKNPNSFFLAAVLKSKIAGYIILLKRSGSKNLRIYSIAVSKESRNRHIGTLLLNISEKIAEAENKTAITLEVSINNPGAIAFYNKHGFTISGRISVYYLDGSDALKMIKYI